MHLKSSSLICPSQTRYLYLHLPFFMKHFNLFLSLKWGMLVYRVENSSVFIPSQEKISLNCMYCNKSSEFLSIHICFTSPLKKSVSQIFMNLGIIATSINDNSLEFIIHAAHGRPSYITLLVRTLNKCMSPIMWRNIKFGC